MCGVSLSQVLKHSPHPRLDIFVFLTAKFKAFFLIQLPFTMASAPDASMEAVIETIDFSEGALAWLQANRSKLEDMVEKKQTIYSLEEWEEFERWAYSKTNALERLEQQQRRTANWIEHTALIMEADRKEMMERIAYLEKGPTFSSMKGFPEFGIGMIALEKLVCDATKESSPDGELGQLPPDGEALIVDHLGELVARMGRLEKWKKEMGLCLTMQWQGDCGAFEGCHF